MKFLIIIAVAIFSFSLAHGNNDQAWNGGYIIPQSKYPAVVQIFMGNYRCSASIVSPNVILTAGHCNEDFSGNTRVPFKGGHFFIGKTRYNFTFYTHKAVMQPELNDPMGGFDMAIGIIDRDVKGVKPLSINFNGSFGKKMIALGYGCTAKYLTETFVKTRNTGSDSRFLISTTDEQVFACGGDSGGPTLAYTPDLRLQITGVHFMGSAVSSRDIHGDKRTDTAQVYDFIQTIASQKNLNICGYNIKCD